MINKILLLIIALLGMGATVNKEHLDFRPEISTTITRIVMDEDEVPVIPPDINNDCPCDKKTGIITQGDGHKTKCPCVNGECGCVNEPSLPSPPMAPKPIEFKECQCDLKIIEPIEFKECQCDLKATEPIEDANSFRKSLLQKIFRR